MRENFLEAGDQQVVESIRLTFTGASEQRANQSALLLIVDEVLREHFFKIARMQLQVHEDILYVFLVFLEFVSYAHVFVDGLVGEHWDPERTLRYPAHHGSLGFTSQLFVRDVMLRKLVDIEQNAVNIFAHLAIQVDDDGLVEALGLLPLEYLLQLHVRLHDECALLLFGHDDLKLGLFLLVQLSQYKLEH